MSRWQYVGIMWTGLCSVKLIDIDFLNQNCLDSYPIALLRLGGLFSRTIPFTRVSKIEMCFEENLQPYGQLSIDPWGYQVHLLDYTDVAM